MLSWQKCVYQTVQGACIHDNSILGHHVGSLMHDPAIYHLDLLCTRSFGRERGFGEDVKFVMNSCTVLCVMTRRGYPGPRCVFYFIWRAIFWADYNIDAMPFMNNCEYDPCGLL